MRPTKLQLDVVIVGAGIGGLGAAISCQLNGHKVIILEQAAELKGIGAGIQVPPNASRILRRWGILQNVQKNSVVPEDLRFRSYNNGKILSRQNLDPFTQEIYGAPYLHIHRADLHRELVRRAEELGVELKLGFAAVLIDLESKRPAVYSKDGEGVEGDVVFGADGLKSICRQNLLENKYEPAHLTGDLAYRIVIKTEEMRKHPELSELYDRPGLDFWLGPDAHAVCYFVQKGELCNIVLLCPDNLPEMVNTQKADLTEMRYLFRGWDPRLTTLLGMVQESVKWRLLECDELQSWCHRDGRVALLGDACHAMLPYLTQGAAQALEDADVLGVLFKHVETTEQIPDILRIYELVRKSRTTRITERANQHRAILHMADGLEQVKRDHDLLVYHDYPFEGFPNPWRDPVFQSWLFSWDSQVATELANVSGK